MIPIVAGTRTILVVDDDESILSTVVEFLALEGFQVESATNGAEALAALERRAPSLVLLDMRMPVLDGWEFARVLHAKDEAPPILVMTASHHTKQWAEEIGATGYIAKPFDLGELLTAIERICPAA